MKYRFRPWQLAAALIAVCAIVVTAVIWLRQSRKFTASELLASLPAEAGALLFINAAALRDAGILDAILGKTVNEEAEYRDFVSQTGFDYKTDLDQVLARFTDSGGYFVVNGKFDWTRIMQYAVRAGGSCHNGFCKVQGSQPQRQISFYPVRPHVMALAVAPSDEAARGINLRYTRSDKQTLPDAPLWLMAPGSVIRKTSKLPGGTLQFARVLQNAESLLLTLGPDQAGFVAGMEVDCRNPEDAALLKTQMEELTNIVKKMIAQEHTVPNAADLGNVLTQGTFERRNRQVVGRWPVPRIFLDALSEKTVDGPLDMPAAPKPALTR